MRLLDANPTSLASAQQPGSGNINSVREWNIANDHEMVTKGSRIQVLE